MEIEFIGWLASILFLVCGIPQAILCIRQGHARGMSTIAMWTWFLGEVLMLVYLYLKDIGTAPLYFNYIVNLLSVGLILWFIHFPKIKTKTSLFVEENSEKIA